MSIFSRCLKPWCIGKKDKKSIMELIESPTSGIQTILESLSETKTPSNGSERTTSSERKSGDDIVPCINVDGAFVVPLTKDEIASNDEAEAEAEPVMLNSGLLKKVSFRAMNRNKNVYHNHVHVIQVVNFARKLLKLFCIPYHDNRYRCVITAAYLHDIYHPANAGKEKIENIILATSKMGDTKCKKEMTLEEMHANIASHIIRHICLSHKDMKINKRLQLSMTWYINLFYQQISTHILHFKTLLVCVPEIVSRNTVIMMF